MQNKGFIRVFAILLVLAGLYSLSFTYFTYKANKDANEYSQGDFQKRKEFMDSIESLEGYYNFLGLRKFTLRECRERELNLGLDLKGGMNVTLQISIEDMIVNLSDKGMADPMMEKTINRARELEKSSGNDFVTLFGEAFNELFPNQNMRLLFLGNEDISEKITYKSTNDEVLKVLRSEATAAFENSFNIIRTRIDRFGVTQPNIQDVGNGRILVELPGVTDPDRVRDLLESSADLAFWETFNNSEVYPIIFEMNTLLADINKLKDEKPKATADTTKTVAAAKDTTKEKLSIKDQIKQDTASVAKADSVKSKEEIRRENPLFSYFVPNMSQEGRPGLGPVLGYARFDDMQTIDSLLAMPQIKALFAEKAPELKLAWTKKSNENDYYSLVALKDVDRDGKPTLDGKVVVDARPQFQQTDAYASVQMTMNNEGAKDWKRITKENAKEKRSIAIVLDGYVYSFPTVQNEIAGGVSSITGDFSIQEATDLANILKSGKLSAKAEILNAEFVGPSLGQESINYGIMSFVIAFFLILIYMALYYQKAGYIANIALMLNLFLIFSVLASLSAVLTLPGIAGLVLTLGMAVDTNVIIYERVREEMSAGKGIKLAISDGFKNAYSAIIDGNITTLIIGIILYTFGSGPIQGFATTLIIGILTSLFCGIFITRLIFERMLDKKSDISFDTKFTRNAFKNLKIDFLGKRKLYYTISTIVIVIGLISIATRQFNLGVDFSGGRSYIVQIEGERSVSAVEKTLQASFGEMPEIKTYGDDQLKITTDYMISERGSDVDSIVEIKLYEGLKPLLGDTDFNTFITQNLRQADMVGPTIADDIIWGATISMILALLSIFVYIFIRFKNWQFGLGGVIALFHDVLIVLGVFSLLWGFVPFSLEINQAFIAALLTVVGYSINDTVIVYDRIREYNTEYPNRNTLQLYNSGINSTISRTINTSATTLVVLLAILFFGGESIRGFVFAMTIGIGVGTYSSICVAAPITYDLLKRQKKIVE